MGCAKNLSLVPTVSVGMHTGYTIARQVCIPTQESGNEKKVPSPYNDLPLTDKHFYL